MIFAPATRANVVALIPAYLEARHIYDVASRVLQQLAGRRIALDGRDVAALVREPERERTRACIQLKYAGAFGDGAGPVGDLCVNRAGRGRVGLHEK